MCVYVFYVGVWVVLCGCVGEALCRCVWSFRCGLYIGCVCGGGGALCMVSVGFYVGVWGLHVGVCVGLYVGVCVGLYVGVSVGVSIGLYVGV